MLREKDWKNVRRTRRNRLFCFTGQICAGLSWLFDRRKFFSFPRASCIELFLPPCFSISDEGEKNVPDKSGRTRPSGSRRRWRKDFRSNGRSEFFGELRRTTRKTRKAREGTEGSRKNESTKNVASVLFRTEGTGLRSGQLFRCASCGTAQLTGFGVDLPSKSRVTATTKERERTDRQRTSPLFFLRTEGTGLRSGQLFRCVSCGTD